MSREYQSRKKYTSDLTDEQWTVVAPLLPPAKSSPRGGRPRHVDLRGIRLRPLVIALKHLECSPLQVVVLEA